MHIVCLPPCARVCLHPRAFPDARASLRTRVCVLLCRWVPVCSSVDACLRARQRTQRNAIVRGGACARVSLDLRRGLFHRRWFQNARFQFRSKHRANSTVVTHPQLAITCFLKPPPLKPPPTQVPSIGPPQDKGQWAKLRDAIQVSSPPASPACESCPSRVLLARIRNDRAPISLVLCTCRTNFLHGTHFFSAVCANLALKRRGIFALKNRVPCKDPRSRYLGAPLRLGESHPSEIRIGSG